VNGASRDRQSSFVKERAVVDASAASNGKETPKAVFRAVTDARLEETKRDPSHARGVRARGDAVGAASRSGRAIGGIALWSIARRTW
jgi:hypothetical protein